MRIEYFKASMITVMWYENIRDSVGDQVKDITNSTPIYCLCLELEDRLTFTWRWVFKNVILFTIQFYPWMLWKLWVSQHNHLCSLLWQQWMVDMQSLSCFGTHPPPPEPWPRSFRRWEVQGTDCPGLLPPVWAGDTGIFSIPLSKILSPGFLPS